MLLSLLHVKSDIDCMCTEISDESLYSHLMETTTLGAIDICTGTVRSALMNSGDTRDIGCSLPLSLTSALNGSPTCEGNRTFPIVFNAGHPRYHHHLRTSAGSPEHLLTQEIKM